METILYPGIRIVFLPFMSHLYNWLQVGSPLEEDLGSWGHHFNPASIPDAILQASAGNEVC